MPTKVYLRKKALPRTSGETVNGNDLIVRMIDAERFPHITFHADLLEQDSTHYTMTYNSAGHYHVNVRLGVYLGRIYNNGWKDNPADTTQGIFPGDKATGESVAADIESVLEVFQT